jgi:beta-aspartyl-peptidase (threonine type)
MSLNERPSFRLLALIACAAVAAACASSSRPAPRSASAAAAAPGAASIDAAVRAVLDAQVAAWNRNDLEAFMAGYEKSDAMVFTSGGNVRRGYETALARYKTAYPDLRKAGVLSFRIEDITPIGAEGALVLGYYHLEGETNADGVFTLVLRKNADGWKIIHDHTSKSEPAAQ